MDGRERERGSQLGVYVRPAGPPGGGRVRAEPGVGGRGRERGAEVERRDGRLTINQRRQLHQQNH